jgi:hypothetical protein
VQVLEAGQVAPHDDHVHALGVLDVEVAHGLAVAGDPERQRLPPELERVAAVADREAANGHLAVDLRLGAAGVDIDAAAGERGAGEHEREQGGKAKHAAKVSHTPRGYPVRVAPV